MPTYTLQNTVLQGETTVIGTDNYQGGVLHDQNNRQIGTFTMVTQTFNNVTDRPTPENLNTGMLELQLFFDARGHGHHGQGQGGGGGGGGSRIQETMVLQGAPEFAQPAPPLPTVPAQPIGAREVTRAHGSVSAATPLFAAHIGKQWSLNGTTLTIV